MGEVVRTKNLTKTFGGFTAVEDLNLSIKKGDIYGFLGLNGAGKTTTIKMLLGLIAPTWGDFYLMGKKIGRGETDIWNQVGYIVETPYSYPELTVKENLQIVCKLRGIGERNRIERTLEKLKLEEYKTKKVHQLSMGNAQRLGIAKAIIHKPEILLLDEPTNGLDPAGVVEVRELLLNLAKKDGVTILISSHRLDEISRIATKIGVIHQGKLIKEIDGGEIKNYLKRSLLLNGRDRAAIKDILAEAGYKVTDKDDKSKEGEQALVIHDEEAVKAPEQIATLLVKAGHPPTLLKVEEEDLEMFFLRTIKDGGGI